MSDSALWLLVSTTREVTLLALLGVLLGGIDDVAVDLIWFAGLVRRRLRRETRASFAELPPPQSPGRIAVFIPAWDEAKVIGDTLTKALAAIRHRDYRLYVGTYPNDSATIAAVRAVNDPRVRLVGGTRLGPTTKAECLNRLWEALRRDEEYSGVLAKAVVLHDAEDQIHPLELRLYDSLIERLDFIQIPVLPLANRSRLVSGHYIDEFTDGHARQLVVRQMLGASLPSAGVGCAFSRRAMLWLARRGEGQPFSETSLTEDYEAGLRLSAFPGRKAFVAMPVQPGGELIAVRAEFPSQFWQAVRQKTRWKIGISLAGWDRLGWRGSLGERWMLLRDRKVVVAAFVVATAYVSLGLIGLLWAAGLDRRWLDPLHPLILVNMGFLAWRLAIRFATVGCYYGGVEAVLSVPRVIVANLIAVCSAARAVWIYRPGTVPRWDKTAHFAPQEPA